jgi:hypothetical protein
MHVCKYVYLHFNLLSCLKHKTLFKIKNLCKALQTEGLVINLKKSAIRKNLP